MFSPDDSFSALVPPELVTHPSSLSISPGYLAPLLPRDLFQHQPDTVLCGVRRVAALVGAFIPEPRLHKIIGHGEACLLRKLLPFPVPRIRIILSEDEGAQVRQLD